MGREDFDEGIKILLFALGGGTPSVKNGIQHGINGA